MTQVTFTVNNITVDKHGDIVLKVSNETLMSFGEILHGAVGPFTVTIATPDTPATDTGAGVVKLTKAQRTALATAERLGGYVSSALYKLTMLDRLTKLGLLEFSSSRNEWSGGFCVIRKQYKLTDAGRAALGGAK